MPANMPMDLSVIIVNWNSVDYLRNCLKSIYGKVHNLVFEVIVLDNASYDGSAEMCAVEFPQVAFLQAEKNLGFSRANNQAFLRSRGRAVLFLNPDTEILDDAVMRMYEHLHSRPGIGAVGCRVLNSDLTPQLQYVQAFPTLLNQILTTKLLVSLFPQSRLWGCAPMLGQRLQPYCVDVICGSCIMVRRDVYEEVRGFDEDYFMYVEDVALCYAIRQAGWEVQYDGSGSVVHHGGKSSAEAKESHFSALMQRESLTLFFRKSRGSAYATLFKVTTAVGALGRFACLPFLAVYTLCCRRPGSVSRVFSKWWKLLRWSIGLEVLAAGT
jgi:N-acetylglucosaminyl-diphospho-decaprenol L-rhamnosyltransferase